MVSGSLHPFETIELILQPIQREIELLAAHSPENIRQNVLRELDHLARLTLFVDVFRQPKIRPANRNRKLGHKSAHLHVAHHTPPSPQVSCGAEDRENPKPSIQRL